MKNEKVSEEIQYITQILDIMENNFSQKKKKRVIPMEEIHDMMVDLYKLFVECYANEQVRCSIISIKRYIPLLNMLMRIDRKNANEYQMHIKNAFKMAARTSFAHYMVYREWDDKDKFFSPRFEIMEGYVHYLEEIAKNPNFTLLIANMPSGYGKLIANDIPVLTRKGWKKHGDLVVGDEVLSPKGEFIKVKIVHPKRFANTKVTFEDGEEIICHNQHEWQVYDRTAQKEKQVETTYIMEHCHCKGGRNRFYLPLIQPVKGEHKDLPIDPYTYGVWLGDGSTNGGRITQNINDTKIFDYIPYEITSVFDGVNENVKTYYLTGLETDLHKIGLCYQKHTEEKYIYDSYLTADIEQRLELLAGIIDTDGYLDKAKQRYIITTCGEKLKENIISLISTFNWRVSVTTVPPTTSTSGIVGKKDVFYIGFSPTMKIPCKLERKQIKRLHKQRRIGIKNVEFVPVQEGNCITVDGGLYLVGKTLKMTHNTYPEKISEAWNFGIDNTGTVLSLCSNDDVVKGGSRTVIDEMKSEHFGEVFPDMKWDKEDKQYFLKETDSNWKLKKCKLSSSYYARTTQSNVVGCRASQRIHIDDLYADYKEAMNQNLNEYYYNKFLTVWRKRFVQNKDAKVVVTGTLWASGDFIALLIEMVKKQHKFHPSEKYKYTQVSEDGTIAIVQVPALDYETGYSTCPDLKTTAEILEEKRNMDEYLFETNFQQRPTDPEALAFSYNKLRTYETIPPSDFQSGYAVIDATRKKGRDFFAMPIFVKVPNGDVFDYYLKDCLFTQTATKDMYEAICEKIMEHHIIKLVIESNVTSELKKNIDDILAANGVAFCEIGEKYNYENKEARITDQKGNISRKLVFPSKDLFGRNTDMGAFMNNLTLYNTRGGNEHDDAPDACGMFCHEIIEEGGFSPKIQVLKRPF